MRELRDLLYLSGNRNVGNVELCHNGLVLRHENLHDAPADEISHGADAEDNHVAGRLALEAHELKGFALLLGIGEQSTGTLVDKE